MVTSIDWFQQDRMNDDAAHARSITTPETHAEMAGHLVLPLETEEAFNAFLSANKLVIVDFWATWCGEPTFEPCLARFVS
jgi:hypothetical protein